MSSKSITIIGPQPNRVEVDVDVPTKALKVYVVNPGGGGGGTQYLEDSAHASGDTGTMTLVVRKDAAGSLVSTDGDYAPLQVDATGALRVTGGGGGTQYAEDTAHVTGDTGTLALVVRNDTPGALAGSSGDYAPLQVDATGRLRVAIDASVALAVGDNGGSLTIDGTVAVSNFPAVQPVSDNGSSLTVDGTVAATQSGSWSVTATQTTHANLNATVRLQDRAGSALLDVRVPAVPASEDANGLVPMFYGYDAILGGAPSLAANTYNHGYISEQGEILTRVGNLVAVRTLPGNTIEVVGTLAIGPTVTPGTDAANLGKAEDAAHTTGDVGVLSLVVRNDTPGSLVDTNGDYAPLQVDGTGRLRVAVDSSVSLSISNFPAVQPVSDNGGSLTVDGSVSISAVTPGTGSSNLGKAEDAAHTTGDVGVMALAVRNDGQTALAGTTGDYVPITTSSTGALWIAQNTHANLNATVRVQDGDGSGLMDVVQIDEALATTERGVPAMCRVVRNVGNLPTLLEDTWSPSLIERNTGGMLVHLSGTDAVVEVSITSSIGIQIEDAPHVSGHAGVMSLAVRNDTPAALAGTTLDYIPLTTDKLGRLWSNSFGVKATYRAATTSTFAAAAGAAMFFAIGGSSTKTVIVQRIKISGLTLTAVEYLSAVAEKWSTAPTGGTSTALTKVPTDSGDAAATATLVQVYTAAPTEGTLVGTVVSQRLLGQATTAAASGQPVDTLEFDFRNAGEGKSGIYLRGTAQVLSLAFGAAPASAVTMSLEVEWTEE